ncbi:MAG: NADH-quinone oxidoreductase subunit L [Acidilobaceae archaeon]
MAEYESLFPWIFSWLAPFIGSFIIALGLLARVRDERFYGYTSVFSILVSAIIASYASYKVLSEGRVIYSGGDIIWIPWINVTLGTYFDGLSAIMSLVVSWVSLLIAVYSIKYMEGDWGYGRYFFFFTFFVGSMLLLVLADNFILMFIGWEGTGLCSYALISHWYTDEEDKWVGKPGRYALGFPMFFEPTHSGVRAILFTRVGDLGLLLGIVILYALTGTFNIVELVNKAPEWLEPLASKGILSLLLITLTLGALAKSAQFPFHEWLVTAMTGPTPISALIHAATMVKAGIYLFLRLTPILLSGALLVHGEVSSLVTQELYNYFLVVAVIGALTAFMLASMALVSDEIKLILAYSTASQIGYMFLGAASAGLLVHTLKPEIIAEGLIAGLSHLASHAVFKAALFLVAGWLIHVAHSRFIDPMGGYAKYMRLTALSLWLAGLSLAGLPPLSGFFSKELVIHISSHAAPLLSGLAILTAMLTAAYTIRLVLRVLHLPPYEAGVRHKPGEAPSVMLTPYLVLAIASLAIGLSWPIASNIYMRAAELTLALGVGYEASVSLSTLTLIVVSAITASIATVYIVYYVIKLNFSELIAKNRLSRVIYDFLYDRWLINPAIYAIFKNGGLRVANTALDIDESIDYTYHNLTPSIGSIMANYIRGVHRGRTDYYITLYIVSAVLIILLALIAIR